MENVAPQIRTNAFVVGVMAGILGGILIDLFLIIANHANPIQVWQFIASGLVGSAAFTSASFAWLGLALHFFTSIVFGVVYAYAAIGLRALARQPILSGLVYGVIVMIVMQFVTAIVHLSPAGPPEARMIIVGLIAHTVFFGLPVALYVARKLTV